jgi:hypothetical protein
MIMTPINEDLVDLGAASVETKGAFGVANDDILKQAVPGLSND